MTKIWPRDTILIKDKENIVKKICRRDTILIKGEENMANRCYPH